MKYNAIKKEVINKVATLEIEFSNKTLQLGQVSSKKREMFGALFFFGILIVLHQAQVLPVPTWLIICFWIIEALILLVVLFEWSAFIDYETETLELETQKLKVEKDLFLSTRIGTPTYFANVIKNSIESLKDNHNLVKKHTAQSFRASLFISLLGFILIATGLIIGFYSDKAMIGYISSGTGLLIEFISGVLFYLYNKTVRQLKEHNNNLMQIQNLLVLTNLIETLPDPKAKIDATSKLIDTLTGQIKPVAPQLS